MARESAYLDNIYSVDGGDEMRRYYDDWAKSYDADLVDNDYRTPARCAEALSRHLGDKSAPLLDFACGTGMSGVALHDAGFTHIDGIDISQGMLDVAREKNAYRQLWVCDPDEPFDTRAKGYAAIIAVGAIGAGAAPVSALDGALAALESGGLLVVSLNDHTLQDPQFEEKLRAAEKAGSATILEDAHGPHLPAIGLGAKVYVVRRT
ncbi:MAG: methyltransferase domain-containing protein [Salinarimonas sp.]|nr:methyltransferase domain-containing protein [Salinarimonas sp.]